MQTIQMTLNDDLAQSLDQVVKKLETTRFDGSRLEQEHRKGYELHPVSKGELGVWEDEQDLGDE